MHLVTVINPLINNGNNEENHGNATQDRPDLSMYGTKPILVLTYPNLYDALCR